MLSVHCMLNEKNASSGMLPTCPPINTTPTHKQQRSHMLDITSLLCHDNDDDDLHNTSRTTTPSLSTASSPISTSSSMTFNWSSPISNDTSYNNIPFSFTAPSAYSPPLPQYLAYDRFTSSKTHNHFIKPLCHVTTALHISKQQQQQQQQLQLQQQLQQQQQQQRQQQQSSSTYHYQHRLLLFVDDDADILDQWLPMGRNKYNYVGCDMTDDDNDDDEHNDKRIKTKRKRATNKQLQVLNRVFQHTFFPSTHMRAQLGRQLGMSPRTVQIWFQNRRQALRTKERQRWMV